jgi:hypothetical protein
MGEPRRSVPTVLWRDGSVAAIFAHPHTPAHVSRGIDTNVKRPCLTCGAPTTGSYCPAHRRTTTQRGYGAAHQRARAQLAQTLPTPCAYGCGTILYPGGRWVAAHIVDGDPSAAWIVSCRSCNERAKHRQG